MPFHLLFRLKTDWAEWTGISWRGYFFGLRKERPLLRESNAEKIERLAHGYGKSLSTDLTSR